MSNRFDRVWAWSGIAAVVLWVVGIFVIESASGLADKASDAETLSFIQDNANRLLLGGWLFMLGCLFFICFASALRARLLAAEGGDGLVTTIAFVGAVATAIFGMLIPAGDIDAAISEEDLSASAATALHSLGDAFFVAAELSAILLMAGVAILSFRTGVFPRWWGIVSALIGVVLLIGPIGWAALIFGLPVWIVVTTFLMTRPVPAPAVAP